MSYESCDKCDREVPVLIAVPVGDHFELRCEECLEECLEEPAAEEMDELEWFAADVWERV